jgi:hypothetical protein
MKVPDQVRKAATEDIGQTLGFWWHHGKWWARGLYGVLWCGVFPEPKKPKKEQEQDYEI